MWEKKNNAAQIGDGPCVTWALRALDARLEIARWLKSVGHIDSAGILSVIEAEREASDRCRRAFLRINTKDYALIHGQEAVDGHLFANLGCEVGWHHPLWRTIPTENLQAGAALPFDNDSLRIVYLGHGLAQCPDAAAEALLSEIHRTLAPGGHLRIMVRDFDIAFDAYRAGWREQFLNVTDFAPIDVGQTVGQLFLSTFAGGLGGKVTDYDLAQRFSVGAPVAVAEALCAEARQGEAAIRAEACNWYTFEKLERMVRRAGFGDVRRSYFGQSRAFVLHDTAFFDIPLTEVSVFVDAVKPLGGDA